MQPFLNVIRRCCVRLRVLPVVVILLLTACSVALAGWSDFTFILIVNDDPGESGQFTSTIQPIANHAGQTLVLRYSNFQNNGQLDAQRLLTVGLGNALDSVQGGRPVVVMILDHGNKKAGRQGISIGPGLGTRGLTADDINNINNTIGAHNASVRVIWLAGCFAGRSPSGLGTAQDIANRTGKIVIASDRFV